MCWVFRRLCCSLPNYSKVTVGKKRNNVHDNSDLKNIIGKKPHGNVLIIDDVISAGTAGRESIEAILKLSATPSSFIVGLDRQEKGLSEMSSREELEKDFNIKVESIVNLDSLIDFVKDNGVYTDHLDQLNEYRADWGT